MSKLLEGKFALILGIANKWSLAYAIAQAFSREGATLVLTYLGEKQKDAIEELSKDLNVAAILPCDVTKDDDLAALTESLQAFEPAAHAVVHSLAFANREDLSRPFIETSRSGFLLAQDVSAYSLVAVARAVAPVMTEGGSLSTLTYRGLHARDHELQRDGRGQGLARSRRALPGERDGRQGRSASMRFPPGRSRPCRRAPSRIFRRVLEAIQTRAPLKRNTDPSEVADTAVFLASDLGRGVTANCLFVDAGMQVLGF